MAKNMLGLDSLGDIAWALSLGTILTAMGVYVVVYLKTSLGSSDATVNATFDAGRDAIGELPGWFKIIAVIIGIVLVVGFLKLAKQ